MSFSPTSRQIVLQEVFDEASVPTDEEIHDYALKIGINIETEPHLFYLARDGLMQALPPGWKPCYDEDKKEIYYFNFKTGKAQWEHPLDDVYRNLVKKARAELTTSIDQVDEDSRTSIKEDLKSFEEASIILPSSEMYPKPRVLEPLSPIGRNAFKKSPIALASMNKSLSKEILKTNIAKSPAGLEDDSSMKKSIGSDEPNQVNKILFDETEVRKRPNSSDIRNRRNIGPMEFRHLSKQDIITPKTLGKVNFLTESKKLVEQNKIIDNQNVENKTSESTPVTKDEGYATEFSVSSLGGKDADGKGKNELTLTGGGSVFLKTNKNKSSPSSDLISPSFSKEELTDGLSSPADARRSSSDIDSHPKGILREKSQKSIERDQIDVIAMEIKSRKEELEEDRKSVRFNLEKELKINFEIPDITSSESEENISMSDRNNGTGTKPENSYSKLLHEDKEDARQIEIDFEDLEIDLSDAKLEKDKSPKNEEEKVPNITEQKTVEPKKFKPSQTLIQEFRDIFEVKTKPKINIPRTVSPINKKDADIDKPEENKSGQSSNRSISSQNEDKSSSPKLDSKFSSQKGSDKNDKIDNLIDLSELDDSKLSSSTGESQKLSGRSEKSLKLKDEIFDSDFGSLVDFAIKKKLFEKETGAEKIVTPPKKNIVAPISPKPKSIFKDKDLMELEQLLKSTEPTSLGDGEDEKEQQNELDELQIFKTKSKANEKLDKELNDNLENFKESFDKSKNENLKVLEVEFNNWLTNVSKSFDDKKKDTLGKLENDFESWKRDQENEFLKKRDEVNDEETLNKMKEIKNEFFKKGQEEIEKLKRQLEEEQKERLKNLKLEIEAQEQKEIEEIRKSFEQNMNEKKLELMRKHKEELVKIERNLEDMLSEQRSQKLKELEIARENEAAIEVMRLELKENYQKQKNNLIKEHESLLENLRQEHIFAVEQLKIEFKNEEEALRKMHMNRLEEKKLRLEGIEGRKSDRIDTQRSDTADVRVFEKVRCEKRLLEDKYKTLKEKYIRLKSETKIALERKKKKEGGATTGSETEKSSSYRTNPAVSKSDYDSPSARRKYETEKKLKLKKQITNLDNVNQNVSTEEESGNLLSPKNLATQLSPNEFRKMKKSPESSRKHKKNEEKQKKLSMDCEKSKDESSGMVDSFSGDEKKSDLKDSRKKRQLFSRLKAASTSRLNFNNRSQEKEDSCLSPVENLRRQLKKLEELEDQFPVTTHTDTYMRYPFTDNPQFGSSEIEFFKHRIHLERDSVRRAKESLKAQKKSFENRQRELKQRLIDGGPGSKSVIEQIYQEEKELTDMEVSVHRTRALLGEKIIRLRHLEHSLRRISQPRKKESFSAKNKDLLGRLGVKSHSKDDDGTLSDLSSHSGSSGFSSTDFNVSDTHNAVSAGGNRTNLELNRRHFQNNMQESSEIIQSLENLNSEIREIWEVLKKQHQSGQGGNTALPPPPLIYSDLGWPAFSLSPPVPFRNTVITSSSNVQRPVAQQYKTQVTASSNLGHVTTVVDSSLIDRTRSLRDWLKAARSSSSPSDVISPNQVTL